MATYLQNSTDVFPEIDYAAPNYQLMSSALGALTQRYNTGFNKLRSMYSSLLNSPVTNPETEKLRQMWFKKNNEQLKQYAHVDLAVSSNVSSALSSFDPLVENKSFVADMNYTRQYQQQAAQINQLKNSTDEKQRKLYNPLMEEYVLRGMQQLKQAKFDDIPNHSVRNYLAVEDPMTYLDAMAKEQNLKIVQEKGSGMYILKKTNGEDAKQEFSEWAERHLGSGQYGEYYNRAASVTVDRQVDAKMQQMPGINREQALQEIGKESLPAIYKTHENYASSIQYNIAQLDKMKNGIINQYGTKIPPDVAAQLQPYAAKRKELQAKLDDLKKRPEAFAQAVQEVVQNYVRNPYGYQANILRSSDARGWASSYADVHAESEMRPDQVKLEMYQQQQQNMRQQRQFDHDLKKAALEHMYRKKEKEYEKQLDAQGTLTEGNPEEATEGVSPMEAFENHITTKVAQSSQAMTDRSVLAVALNLPAHGNRISGEIPGGSLGVLQDAMAKAELAFYRGTPLGDDEKKILDAFTRKVNGQPFRSFNQVQQIINQEVTENKDHPMYNQAVNSLSIGMRNMAEANQLAAKEQQFFAQNASRYPGHFEKDANGRWRRIGNHASDPVLNQVIPDREKYTNATKPTLKSIDYNISNEKNNDMSHVSRSVQNAAHIGYYTSEGQFVEFDPKDAQEVKNIMGRMGSANLRDAVDGNIRIVPGDRYNGQDMVRVIIPLKRSGEKGRLALDAYGLPKDVVQKAGAGNSITIMVPANKANQLGFNPKLMRTENGSIVSNEDFGAYATEAGQRAATQTPFISELMDLNRGKTSVPFPNYLKVKGYDGMFSKSNGQIYITFYDKNGHVVQEEPTGYSEVTPETAVQLENAVDVFINQRNRAREASNTAKRESNRSNVKADWVDINSIY